MAKMPESKFIAIVDGFIVDAQRLDASDRAQRREDALEFFDGKTDIPLEENKSQVVSPDLADALEWIKPGLQRIFLATDQVGIYEPQTEEDEDGAEQATDGINYKFLRECDGFRVINDGMHDGLLHGNGIWKHWWDSTPIYKTETMTGLSEADYEALLDDDTVEEVLEKREYLVGPDGQELKEAEEGPSETDNGDEVGEYA